MVGIMLMPLHAKGLATLWLLLITKSWTWHPLTAASAEASFSPKRFFERFRPQSAQSRNSQHKQQQQQQQSQPQHQSSHHGSAQRQDESMVQATASAIFTPHPLLEHRMQPQRWIRQVLWQQKPQPPHHESADDGWDTCRSNIQWSFSQRSRMTSIPRGGGSGEAAGAAGAAAVALHHETPLHIPLVLWKVIFQAIVTLCTLVGWYVPVRSNIRFNRHTLGVANAFTAGVFLSLALTHMIPECVHGFSPDWPEAAPFLFVLAGYLLIFFVDKIAFDAHAILHEMSGENDDDIDHDHHHHHHGTDEKKPLPSNGHGHSHSARPTTAAAATTTTNTKAAPSVFKSTTSSTQKSASPPTNAKPSPTRRSALILLAALSVHSIMEMVAVGLAGSFSDAALLTSSIAMHQPAESLALFVALLKSGMSQQHLVQFLSVYTAMGPVGVALGMIIHDFAVPTVDAAMLAAVAGTFLYVGATEMIPEEFEDHHHGDADVARRHKWQKFGALLSGMALMIGLTQYTLAVGGHMH